MGVPANRRKPISREIKGRHYTLEPLPPRANLEAFAVMLAIVGEPLSELMTDPAKLQKAFGDTKLGELDLLVVGAWVLERVGPVLENLKPERITDLAERLLVNRLTVDKGNDATLVGDAELLDTLLVDGYELFRLLRLALTLNFRPTTAGPA